MYNDNFEKSAQFILRPDIEGGHFNDPRDPGGETKYGISKRSYPDLDIANLTVDQAKSIYKRDYWDKARCDELPWPVSLAVFDGAVNHGVMTSVALLQKALLVDADGIVGPVTLNAVTRADPVKLVTMYCVFRVLYYSGLNTFKVHGKGWITRVFEVYRGVAGVGDVVYYSDAIAVCLTSGASFSLSESGRLVR